MKVNITNRKSQKVVVLVEEADDPKGLVFIMHGLSGYKEELQIDAFATAFKEESFTVVRFDTTNTFGESDGKYEDATVTNYYEDLEDVLRWAESQLWFKKPFWLVGASLGAMAVGLYSEKYPQDVAALAPISALVSGTLSLEAMGSEKARHWKDSGWREKMSSSHPGLIKRTPWSHMEDRLKYDLLPQASKLRMPVLLIVGSEDDTTPLSHQQKLLEALPGEKELHVIDGAGHAFREKPHLEEVKHVIKTWILKHSR
jgi:hypothetical protein